MAETEQPVKQPGTRAVRPKDAATLIICRQRRNRVEVLMGKRHRKHKFLPDRYVFPGGRVDPQDSRVRSATPIRADVAELLMRRATPARARGIVAAAVRETFEEAGLIIGKPDPQPGKAAPANWRPFFDSGMAPCFENLTYVARAITPPWRPMRFNARFFMIDHRHVAGELGGDGELLDLTYVPIKETSALELPLITTRVLEMVEDLARHPPAPGAMKTVTFFHHNGDHHDLIPE